MQDKEENIVVEEEVDLITRMSRQVFIILCTEGGDHVEIEGASKNVAFIAV